MVDEREHTTRAFACSAFGFYAACIQTYGRKAVLVEINKSSRNCLNGAQSWHFELFWPHTK